PRTARAFEGDELAGVDLESDAVDGTHDRRPFREPLRDVADFVHHSTVLSASAGRKRAARSAPAAPASRPPPSAIANPITSTVAAIGAVSATWSVTVRTLSAPS